MLAGAGLAGAYARDPGSATGAPGIATGPGSLQTASNLSLLQAGLTDATILGNPALCGPGAANCTQFDWSISGGSSPYYLQVDFGDGRGLGSLTNGSVAAQGNLTHVYPNVTTLTTYTAFYSVRDASGQLVNGTLNVTPTYNVYAGTGGSGGGNGSSGAPTYASAWLNSTAFVIDGAGDNGTFRLNLTGQLTPGSGSVALVLTGFVTAPRAGGVNGSIDFGNGNTSTIGLSNTSGSTLPLHAGTIYWVPAGAPGWTQYGLDVVVDYGTYQLAPPTFWLNLTGGNASGGGSGGSGGGSSSYPSPVTVTVGASPVTGPAPLAVTFSAYLDGGAPPFAVTWSLPGGSSAPNGSGLSASQTYATPGWYPATAFVYNTTSPNGTVLVGYGSVWVYVFAGNGTTASGGSGGSGGSGPNASPTAPAHLSVGPVTPAIGSLGTLEALAVVGLAAGAGGYLYARRRVRGPPPPTSEDERGV